jgi:hypothetical protein
MNKIGINLIFTIFLLMMGVIISGCVNNQIYINPLKEPTTTTTIQEIQQRTSDSSIVSSQSPVIKPGDTVVVSFTLYDASGSPMITSDQHLYTKLAASGKGVILSKQLSLIADQSLGKEIYPVPIYTTASPTQQFALFSTEYNAISSAIVGMKTGDQKHITIPSNISMTQEWSAAQLQRNKVNMSDLSVGDLLAMGVSDNVNSYTRMGKVISKSDIGVVVDFSYPSVDVSFVSVN